MSERRPLAARGGRAYDACEQLSPSENTRFELPITLTNMTQSTVLYLVIGALVAAVAVLSYVARKGRNGVPEPDKSLLEQMRRCEALAEKAYDEMYDTRYPTGPYSDLKDYFLSAIAAAQEAGLPEEAERLSKRLAHCKQVFRSQFT
jgi:hypothetical protein